MKIQRVGFALLLFGNILAVADTFFFYAGLAVGFVGLCLVISN